MRVKIVPVVAALVLFSAISCLAAGFESGDVVVFSLPIGDDFYIGGGKVVVTQPVAGDLVAAGGSLIINGPVGADLQIAGGSLLVNGPVADDLRAAGGDVILSSTVGGDLVIYGGSVTIPAGAVVEGDAVIGGGSVHLGGTVRGDLLIHAGTLDLIGTVEGNAKLYATDRINLNGTVLGETIFVGPEISLGSQASFGKDVSYWREGGEMDFGAVPVGGQTIFKPELKGKEHSYPPITSQQKGRKTMAMGGLFLVSLLSGFVVIILSTLLLKGVFRRAGEILHRSYWQSTGMGLLILILLPVAGFLAFITIIGLPIGLFLLIFFAFSLLFGRVIAAMAFAAWLERRRTAQWSTGRLLLVSIAMYTAIKLVSVIPFVGWLAVAFVVWAGYGALMMGLWGGKPAY